MGLAACGPPTHLPSGSPADTGDPSLACPVTQAPGAGDEPPRDSGDLVDLADYGAGRYRLCLTDPPIADFETTAWCEWTEDRTVVRDINGSPTPPRPPAYQGWFDLDRNEFELGVSDGLGRITTYVADAGRLLRDGGLDGRDGYVSFALELSIDPEIGPHPGVLPTMTGAMRWTCGDPPPPG